MTIPYIWLGNNTEVDATNGKLNTTALGDDKWTVRPLLGWDSSDRYTPSILIRQENEILKQLLHLIDAKPDTDDQQLATAIGAGWTVFRFKNLVVDKPGLNLGTAPAVGIAIVTHNSDSFEMDVSTANLKFGLDGLSLVRASAQGISPAAGGPKKIVFTIVFDRLDLTNLGFEEAIKFGVNSDTLNLSFDIDGKLKINGFSLESGSASVPDSGSKHIPLGNTGVALVIEESNATRSVGFEIVVSSGTFTHKPLINGIPESRIDFEWKESRLRLHEDRLGFASPPRTSGSDDVLGIASFEIPLIQAAVGADSANALTKLVPTSDAKLTPLKFKVEITRPAGSLDIEPLMWAVKRTGSKIKAVGELVRTALQSLLAKFESYDDQTSTLSGFFAPLKELSESLTSGLPFKIQSISEALKDDGGKIAASIQEWAPLNTGDYPLPLALTVGSKPDLVFLIVLRLDLWAGRLKSNRAFFYVAAGKGGTADRQVLDLGSFALTLPLRTVLELSNAIKTGLPDSTHHDGYLDFEALDVVLDVLPTDQPNRPQMAVLFPGDLENNKNESERVRILLEDFDPSVWPEPPKDKAKTLQLRLGTRGLTFSAKVDTAKQAKIPISGGVDVPLQLVETRDGLKSGLVVIDNQIRHAYLAGRLAVPGFDSFEVDVALGLRRDQPTGPPGVTAVIDVDRTDRKPLARIKVPLLKAQLDDLRVQLSWKSSKWEVKAWATGALSVTGDLGSAGGIDGLDQPRAIPFRDLNLTELHKGRSGSLRLGRPKESAPESVAAGSTADEVARFELMEKQFRVEFYNSELHWDLDKKEARFKVERARFEYQARSGDLDVAVEAGQIELLFNLENKSLKFKTPSSFGLQVRIGTQLSFAGNVGWEDTPREHYFRADGRLQMTGFPEIAGSLKLGTGIKDNGSTAPNLAIFAELPFEADLFPGVVTKRLGLGLGLNNRLAGIGDRPDPRAILANLDRIDPKQSRNWSFVSQSGVYVSVVATAMIASNRGKDNVVCSYVAKLLLSIDTNIDVVAAAQVWLFSSPEYVQKAENERRPALVGAAVLSARERTFSLVAQTMPRPAIESNEMLSNLLSRVQARFSFYLSSDLADYYLEELSYRDELFGISVLAMGSYRIAIGRFGALMRAGLAIRGDLPKKKLEGGIGGFEFSGNMQLNAEFGGLVTSKGLAAYGMIHVGISFRVSAYVNIPTVAWQTIEYEQTFSITVSIPYLKCKRWKCKWKTREISESVTVKVKLVYPVFSIEPYHLPETSLNLVLEGALAFDESGGIGFSGTIAISTSVCGRALRIAPRFDYRPEVVTNVRRRVAAVEDQINRLRGLPRAPVQSLPANTGISIPPVETWYYYTSRSGDNVLHLLVPSPEYPAWWYTPRASGMSQYANLPRDPGEQHGNGGASPLEVRHLSPFRDAVMRMVLPFKDDKGKIQQVVDLAMPWDRGNYDSLPGDEDDQTLTDLVMKLTQIESAFLNTAAKAEDPLDPLAENRAWEEQERDGQLPLTSVEIVADPRPQSGSRVYWTLTDQLTRPDGIFPYRYRPVQELVSEGFAGANQRDDIGRLLRYEQVRELAATQGRYDDIDPRPARRLAQARAGLVSSILADFSREAGPQTYAPIEQFKLERTDDDTDHTKIITRRRAALLVFPEPGAAPAVPDKPKYIVKLTFAILENSSDLVLEPEDGETEARFEVSWNDSDPAEPFSIEFADATKPNFVNLNLDDPTSNDTRHRSLAKKTLEVAPGQLTIRVKRALPSQTEVSLVFELWPEALRLPVDRLSRQVGLFGVTKAADNLQLDPAQVRIVRNESNSDLSGTNSVPWSNDKKIRIVPMNDRQEAADPIEAIQRWVSCLPPCQEYLTSGENGGEGAPRVRVRLPVRFEEELLKAQLPRLNGFEIYRRFPWEPQPVRIAAGVPPILRWVEERDRTVLLVESFLFTEDFGYNSATGRFTGAAAAVVPGVTPVEYSLRAVPFGRLPDSDTPPTFRSWPAVTLHVPPTEKSLPALGLVVPVESLIQPVDETKTKWTIPFHLVDSEHATWHWPEKSWNELELWAEPRRIRSSGSYAVEGEPIEVEPQSAQQQSILQPDDLTLERLPESVCGKILVARLTRPTASSDQDAWTLAAGKTISEFKTLQCGASYRFFIRPKVATQSPLVQPMSLYVIRSLPPRLDAATPLLHVDRLELVSRVEEERIQSPINSKGLPHKDAWVVATDFQLDRRTEKTAEFERLRISWDHLSDLDAGVEILLQDADEPHRVDRRMVTAQEEAVFQMAIRDFRNPALWQEFPKPISFQSNWKPLSEIRSTTPVRATSDLTEFLLWSDERNPAIERVGTAREELSKELTRRAADIKNADWLDAHRAISDYLAAMLAYQRTPLAPATPEDRAGLEALISVARAMFVGSTVGAPPEPSVSSDPPIAAAENAKNLARYSATLESKEAAMRGLLDELAKIDLSQKSVTDSPADYARIKSELQDIDLARKLASIIQLRLAISEALFSPGSFEESPAVASKAMERLPRLREWNSLLSRHPGLQPNIVAVNSVSPSTEGRVETKEKHGFENGDIVEMFDVKGMTEIEGKRSVVSAVNAKDYDKRFALAVINTLNFTPFLGGNVKLVRRKALIRSCKLLDFLDDGSTGAVAALRTLLSSQMRDPSILLANDVVTKNFRREVAKLVPQAAGLTAAVDALKSDARAKQWTLVRRPHHQLGVHSTESEGRAPVEEMLRSYLPDTLGGPNQASADGTTKITPAHVAMLSDKDLVLPFVNLLERLGFAIDLAVVDRLNQPLSQRGLLDWISNQAWEAIKTSLPGTHDVVLITGREPDTDRDDANALGYAFAKLAVVPRSLLVDLLERRVELRITADAAVDGTGELTVTLNKPKEAFTKAGLASDLELTQDGATPIPFAIGTVTDIGGGCQVKRAGFSGTPPKAGDAVVTSPSSRSLGRAAFRKWLEVRSLHSETHPVSDAELDAVRTMAEAWWNSISDLAGPPSGQGEPQIGHCIVETRSHRWATVPVLGGRGHIDWRADDAAGRMLHVAVRRVSRYEGLLRWARGAAVSILPRIYGLGEDKVQTIQLRRRMQVGEEPTTLPVLVSPHPTRIDFVYALPTSGARATVSGLSARRTGYQGVAAHFAQKRIDGPATLTPNAIVAGIATHELLVKVKIRTVIADDDWTVESAPLLPFEGIIVFDADHKHVRLSNSFVVDGGDATIGSLKFGQDELGTFVVPANKEVDALPHPLSETLRHGSIQGDIERLGAFGERRFRLRLNQSSNPLDDDPATYADQLLVVDKTTSGSTEPVHARLIDSFQPSDQTLTLKVELPGASHRVRILTRMSTAERSTIVRANAGTPTLFRHERLISLADLPYYRKYAMHVSPQFDAEPLASNATPAAPDTVFAERRSSILAVYRAQLIVKQDNTSALKKYVFRLFLTRQGDLLTPNEARTAVELDLAEPEAERPRLLSQDILGRDLPDLDCQYQVLWQLPDSQNDPVFAELVDVLLPGHPAWIAPTTSPAATPVLIRNRNGASLVTLGDAASAADIYEPIQLWRPSPGARPVYVVTFTVNVKLPAGQLFVDPSQAVLQLQRDGFRSRPLPFSIIN